MDEVPPPLLLLEQQKSHHHRDRVEEEEEMMIEEPASSSSSVVVDEEMRVVVDETPLLTTANNNREALKLRLQMRRPMTQLVQQGILPSGPPSAFGCQRVKLERARMSDLLKAKIQQRPSREELVRQHILEETDAAPLLQEKQRMLKRARLADSLNDHLIHRPGPLELVKKNILHAPHEQIDIAIKEGQLNFVSTSEGAPPPPPPAVVVAVCNGSSSSSINYTAETPALLIKSSSNNNKKAKQRTIKFHEYKGPNNKSSCSVSSTSYQLLLEQQQLFLQWQINWQHRFPQILLPAPPTQPPPPTPPPLPPPPLPVSQQLVTTQPVVHQVIMLEEEDNKLDIIIKKEAKDWKVNELKAELKKRNLPVSGSKSQLIQRLGNFNNNLKNNYNNCISTTNKEKKKKEVKSEQVDDVLEILFRNGELTRSDQEMDVVSVRQNNALSLVSGGGGVVVEEETLDDLLLGIGNEPFIPATDDDFDWLDSFEESSSNNLRDPLVSGGGGGFTTV